jgi:hypothetical protein
LIKLFYLINIFPIKRKFNIVLNKLLSFWTAAFTHCSGVWNLPKVCFVGSVIFIINY